MLLNTGPLFIKQIIKITKKTLCERAALRKIKNRKSKKASLFKKGVTYYDGCVTDGIF
jgi:hypothetical protein